MKKFDNIIITSGLRWDFIKQRIHHLTSAYSKRYNVIYIEPARDLVFMFRYMLQNRTLFKFVHKEDNIILISPIIPLKVRKYPKLQQWLEKIFVVNLVKCKLKLVLNSQNNLLITCDPSHTKFLDVIPHTYSIYDCADDLMELSHHRFPQLEEQEKYHMKVVNLVTTTAQALYDRCVKANNHTIIVNNGCYPENFTQEYAEISPESITIGFVGAIEHWLDIELVKYILDNMPQVKFTFIGPINCDVSCISDSDRVFFLGRKPYEELRALTKSFDMCIIPFKVNTLTSNVNPVKLYEYLATGKPVLSTNLPEVLKYRNIVYCADSPAEMVHYIERAVLEHNQQQYEQRIVAAKANSWWHRAKQILDEAER